MGSEDFDKAYLDRTRKHAEKSALPEIFHTLLAGGAQVIDGSFDPSALGEKVDHLRTRLSTQDSWADKGTLSFNLNQAFPGANGVFAVEYDSEVIDENLLRCLKSAYPDKTEEALRSEVSEEFKDYRRIKSFSLVNENHTFDFRKHVPEDWSVYAYTRGDARLINTAYVNPLFHFIMSPQPIDSRLGLHQLVHEAGHVIVDKGRNSEEIAAQAEVRGKRVKTMKEKRIIIQSERDANAFALAHLRHFFGPEDMATFRQLTYASERGHHRNTLTER